MKLQEFAVKVASIMFILYHDTLSRHKRTKSLKTGLNERGGWIFMIAQNSSLIQEKSTFF